MKILLTGASSYVGARLYFDLEKDFDIVGTYNNLQLSKKFIKLDITSPEEIKKVIYEQKPDIIIHAAANANARWCEANPELAKIINETANQHIVDIANEINAQVIFISSYAAIYSESIYAKTKLHAEEYIKQTKSGFIILRPAHIIGLSPNTTNDRQMNRFLKNIDEKTPAVYDNTWKFQPTYLSHISEVITAVIQKNIMNEIIHIAAPELETRYDLAKDILTPFGVTVSPAETQDNSPIFQNDLLELKNLNLPRYTYQEIVEKVIDEIKHREEFKLD